MLQNMLSMILLDVIICIGKKKNQRIVYGYMYVCVKALNLEGFKQTGNSLGAKQQGLVETSALMVMF